MPIKLKTMYGPAWLVSSCVLTLLSFTASAQNVPGIAQLLSCDDNGALCTEVYDSIGYGGGYTGHDEPALLFYSGVPGSGNATVYLMQLPKDPPQPPKQDGSGGTFNFQLHPAFWVGMAMCDDQSAPNPSGSTQAGPNIPCTPDSDDKPVRCRLHRQAPGHRVYGNAVLP